MTEVLRKLNIKEKEIHSTHNKIYGQRFSPHWSCCIL